MGLMGTILGAGGAARQVGDVVGGVAEVFVGNQADREAAELERFTSTIGQFGAEFATGGNGGMFDRFVNALNRLPRPLMTLGTLALFVYAMAEPDGFGLRMERLGLVPEPLWWLLGAIVSFYFGARELHHQRTRSTLTKAATGILSARPVVGGFVEERAPAEAGVLPAAALFAQPAGSGVRAGDPDYNAAVEEWRGSAANGEIA